MPKVKTTAPAISRNKGQRSLDDPLYLTRFLPTWTHPNWYEANAWRSIAASQLACVGCKDAITGHVLSLDWKVQARDSERRDELKDDVDYYTRFIQDTGEYEYSEVIEWLLDDYLTLPFGGAAEVGREGDDPNGRVLWIELLDGGTLFPTLNMDWPYAQSINGIPKVVYFPKHAINRIYMSPRTEIKYKGWGMAPPEKIWFALQLLSRGDTYYANLLLDSPEAGILDLLDMSKDSAEAWVNAWRQMLTGIDPYKIPVLYEHTQKAEFIPFTRNPNEIAFNASMARYDALLCAGYGLTPSDISLNIGQGTLAGNIRDEKKSKRQGFGRARKKIMAWWNRILPPDLEFRYIDIDEETSVAIGRARLAQATAAKALVDGVMFTEEEMRAQTISDGLVTISVPEKLPSDLKQKVDNKLTMSNAAADGAKNGPVQPGKTAERPSLLGRPVSPGQGGWGESAARTKSNVVQDKMKTTLEQPGAEINLSRLMYLSSVPLQAEVTEILSELQNRKDILAWRSAYDDALWSDDPVAGLTSATMDVLKQEMDTDPWWNIVGLDDILNDLTSTLHQMYADLFERENRKSLVKNRKELAPWKPVDDTVLVDWLNQTMPYYNSVWQSAISKAVISGFRDYLLDNPDVDLETAVFMSEAIDGVKSYLEKGMVKIANDFALEASDIIVSAIRKAMLDA